MKRFFLGFLVLLLMSSNIAQALDEPISINGHRITRLSVESEPSKPRVGDAVDTFTVSFRLKSKTGFSKTRLKLLVGTTNISFSGDEINFEEVTDDDEEGSEDPDVDTYDITIQKEQISFNKTDNEVKIQYLLSSVNPSSIQAQRSEGYFARASGNGGNNGGANGGGNGGGGGGTGNGDDVTQIPKLVSLFVDLENGDPEVTNVPTSFRLTVDHDQRFFDAINGGTFNPNTNPFIKNLVITEIDPDDKSITSDVTSEFTFTVEEDSQVIGTGVTGNGNILRTVYISDPQNITDRKNLRFVINLKKFYEKSGVKLEENIITRAKDTIKITAKEIDAGDLDISDSIDFSLSSFTKKKLIYTSNSVNLTGNFTIPYDGDLLSDIETTEFYTISNNNKTLPKITGAKKTIIKPDMTDATASFSSTGDNGYSLTIPLQLNVSTNKSTLSRGKFFDVSQSKTLKVPFTLTGKTSDDLDVIIRGTFNETVEMVFEAAPTE